MMNHCKRHIFSMQEAAIYLLEGLEDEDLDFHPTVKRSYKAYMIIHNRAYSISVFLVCILLMLLAFLEKPTFLDVSVHVSLLTFDVHSVCIPIFTCIHMYIRTYM